MLLTLRSIVSKTSRSTISAIRTYSSEVPQFETLAVSVPKKHVYHVEFNRPDKLNSMSHLMFNEIIKCFESLSENPDCRAIVVSGRGKHFTAGIDLKGFVANGAKALEIDDVARRARALYKLILNYQDSMSALERCVKPVLTVAHNGCIGAGVNLICAADMRYCTEDAWFTIKEVDVGLAADIGALQRMPKIVGNESTVRELVFTARNFDAKEALQLGLITRIYPDKDTAVAKVLEIAETIASKSPVAVQTTKTSLVYSQGRPTEDGLLHLRLLNQTMLQSEDLTSSAVAQATKSGPPEYENY